MGARIVAPGLLAFPGKIRLPAALIPTNLYQHSAGLKSELQPIQSIPVLGNTEHLRLCVNHLLPTHLPQHTILRLIKHTLGAFD